MKRSSSSGSSQTMVCHRSRSTARGPAMRPPDYPRRAEQGGENWPAMPREPAPGSEESPFVRF